MTGWWWLDTLVGIAVTAGTQLTVGYDLANVFVTARVKETEIRHVHPGQDPHLRRAEPPTRPEHERRRPHPQALTTGTSAAPRPSPWSCRGQKSLRRVRAVPHRYTRVERPCR